MRRLLIIFLLLVLPLQASWAAVCAYCPDSCITDAETSATVDDALSDAIAQDGDDDCSRCQLGGIGMVMSPATSLLLPPPQERARGEGAPLQGSSQSDRPERPNWTRAA